MTKFGWLVILGALIVLSGVGGGVYVVMQQRGNTPTISSDPNQQIEVVLPPDTLTQDAASTTEPVATSSHATTSTAH